jgi:hypothetical protein
MLGIAAYSFVIDNWDIGLRKSVLRILSVCDLQESLVVFSHGLSSFKIVLDPGAFSDVCK